MMKDYIDFSYEPQKNDLVCEYYVEPNRIPLQKAANHLAGESSIDTWSDIHTLNETIRQKLMPHVFYINSKTNAVRIAYHYDLFEAGNIPQILSSIAGNVFGMKAIRNLRLQDVTFPKKIVTSFHGPRLGVKGVRKLLHIPSRPLVGTIVKPKLGLTAKQHAQVAYGAWMGGIDCVKDDENLTSMNFNKFKERIDLTLRLKDRAELETGERKAYMPNITAETSEMIKRLRYVQDKGGNYIMVDILTSGWSALQTVRRNSSLPIHAHRAMHGALTRNEKHGISMLFLAKIARMIGVDTLHIGTVDLGKMGGSEEEVTAVQNVIQKDVVQPDGLSHVLKQKWYGLKPVLATASGGLQPGVLPELVKRMGKDILANFGGGIHAHPDGTRAGAKAVRQALDACLRNVPIREYAATHPELAKAIKEWGTA
ncbi:MAG: type III ribulose-bisphosphate carboxylase [archaeon]